ncbi:MAG: efflux RND transporter permease subunit [Myxococcales bacterium]|nr:efflux RND transporter permease subunit [Myxococcales bacterium]
MNPNLPRRGSISWMARHKVAANLVMIVLLVGGAIVGTKIKQEVFPEFDLDLVTITVPYPGASPEEVEQGIITVVEEAVRGLDGVKKVTSTATEGAGSVSVELLLGANSNKALQDIKNAVDRITSFPEEAERPVVSLAVNRREVISLVLYGDLREEALKTQADRARDELLALPDITLVEISGTRDVEVNVEVPQDTLRRYNLTLDGIAGHLARASIDLPAGEIKAENGNILLRTKERRDYASEFREIPIVSSPDGTTVRLSDVAKVRDDFADNDIEAYYNGQRAVMLKVFRVGDQTPIQVAETVKKYVSDTAPTLPPGLHIATWRDDSEVYRDRIDLLMRNAYLGLILVFISLGLFLEIRLAFWVTMGIPISFLGSFLILPLFGVSFNMISLFAFILTLGIVVDDAIVVGENVYELRHKGMSFLQAAVKGTKEVAGPVVFSVLTTVAAFLPLIFVPGTMGKFFGQIPAVVISVLMISLFESLFILPAHLGHTKPVHRTGIRGWLHHQQERISLGLAWLIRKTYEPVAKLSLNNRYVTVSAALAMLIGAVGLVGGGRINFTFMPKVDSDLVSVRAVLPFGTPVNETRKVQERLLSEAREIVSENGGEQIVRGLFSIIGQSVGGFGPGASTGRPTGGHTTTIQLYMVPTDQRKITASEFANLWRKRTDDILGLENLTFTYSTGPGATAAITVQLRHTNLEVLETAAEDLAATLQTFAGVKDINDGFAQGKPQLDLKVTHEARSLGVTATDLARQIRNAFFGAESIRQQRGRDEVRVMVRLPEDERRSEFDIHGLMVKTPDGGEIPFERAATFTRGHSYTEIRRTDGQRVVDVTADVDPLVTNAGKVLEEIKKGALEELTTRYPGLTIAFEGTQRDQRESLSGLGQGYLVALIVIFALLAIPFKSYVQPLVVMVAIPFGIIGAILGHFVMGYDLSLMSIMGIVALSGIAVNDSLVMVVAANDFRREGYSSKQAALMSGTRRFRPILLTSLTTFLGLAPMIFETSVQARFLIPMALSLGYGVLFSTFIVLLLVPALYVIVDDIRHFFGMLDDVHPDDLDVEPTVAPTTIDQSAETTATSRA